jgi:Protein of unknown function (DUF2934)
VVAEADPRNAHTAFIGKGPREMDDLTVGKAHEVTALRAYDLWEQGGRRIGSHELDWFAAEKVLAQEGRSRNCRCTVFRWNRAKARAVDQHVRCSDFCYLMP